MPEKRTPLILDLHIPYCIQPENFLRRYHLVGSNHEKNVYLTCLGREILSYEGDLDGYEIQAVRLGGGSASVMSPDLLGKVLSLVRDKLPVAAGAEFSYDALPNTIGTPSLTGIAAGHPNRVELMARSENEQELRTLNCPFTVQDTHNAMLFFGKFHLNNVGMTVNYGIPGQTMQSWHNTLHSCEIMRPGHITVEPLDTVSPEDEPLRWEMYSHAVDYLAECGYTPYGVGLFCLPEYEYRFRVLQSSGTPVIGMGVGNVSRFEGFYVRNTNNNALYMKNAGNYEKLTAQVLGMDELYTAREYVYGRLGLREGFSEAEYERKYGAALPDVLYAGLDALVQKGWAQTDDGKAFVLTRCGEFHYREIRL